MPDTALARPPPPPPPWLTRSAAARAHPRGPAIRRSAAKCSWTITCLSAFAIGVCASTRSSRRSRACRPVRAAVPRVLEAPAVPVQRAAAQAVKANGRCDRGLVHAAVFHVCRRRRYSPPPAPSPPRGRPRWRLVKKNASHTCLEKGDHAGPPCTASNTACSPHKNQRANSRTVACVPPSPPSPRRAAAEGGGERCRHA